MKNMGLIIHFDNDMHFDMGLTWSMRIYKTWTREKFVVERKLNNVLNFVMKNSLDIRCTAEIVAMALRSVTTIGAPRLISWSPDLHPTLSGPKNRQGRISPWGIKVVWRPNGLPRGLQVQLAVWRECSWGRCRGSLFLKLFLETMQNVVRMCWLQKHRWWWDEEAFAFIC